MTPGKTDCEMDCVNSVFSQNPFIAAVWYLNVEVSYFAGIYFFFMVVKYIEAVTATAIAIFYEPLDFFNMIYILRTTLNFTHSSGPLVVLKST
ncbi:MAG: hypothetical protein GY786_24540 [Proteobacteria bacterium]|nr:hypothetical protein [Pseudomonadota bacterium]